MPQGGLDWEMIAMFTAAGSFAVIAWDWVVSREDGVRMRRALNARLRVPEQPAAIVARK